MEGIRTNKEIIREFVERNMSTHTDWTGTRVETKYNCESTDDFVEKLYNFLEDNHWKVWNHKKWGSLLAISYFFPIIVVNKSINNYGIYLWIKHNRENQAVCWRRGRCSIWARLSPARDSKPSRLEGVPSDNGNRQGDALHIYLRKEEEHQVGFWESHTTRHGEGLQGSAGVCFLLSNRSIVGYEEHYSKGTEEFGGGCQWY